MIKKLFLNILAVFTILLLNPIFLHAKEDKGICLSWSEGDGLSLDGCNASTLKECSKGKKAITNKDTSFQNYTGKLFQNTEGNISEFLNELATNCEKRLVKSARNYELTMSTNWGHIVYSDKLKQGDKAFIHGEKVNVREKPSLDGKVVYVPKNLTEVNILQKTKERIKVADAYEAYWFKISDGKKQGWVYGQFIHPNPKSKKSYVDQ